MLLFSYYILLFTLLQNGMFSRLPYTIRRLRWWKYEFCVHIQTLIVIPCIFASVKSAIGTKDYRGRGCTCLRAESWYIFAELRIQLLSRDGELSLLRRDKNNTIQVKNTFYVSKINIAPRGNQYDRLCAPSLSVEASPGETIWSICRNSDDLAYAVRKLWKYVKGCVLFLIKYHK